MLHIPIELTLKPKKNTNENDKLLWQFASVIENLKIREKENDRIIFFISPNISVEI